MLKYFAVKNFRCFSKLQLAPLTHVNLIAGKNNVGKTALLEALQIFSYPQDVSLPFALQGYRGMSELSNFDADIGSWLFHNQHMAEGLTLSSADEKDVKRTLEVWIVDGVTARQRFPEAERLLQTPFLQQISGGNQPRIILKSENEGQQDFAIGFSTLGGFSTISSRSNVPWAGPSVLIGSGGGLAERELKSFSEVEAGKRQEEMLSSLRILEPRLQRLAILLVAGKPIIHGDIGLPHLVPVALMGEGMRRVLSIVLAITTSSGGRVLIDEVDNGLHHSVMKDVWQAIARAARAADVQVFATTHSWECIQAAHHAFKDSPPYEFRYLRLDRRGEDIVVKNLDENMLDTVEKTDLEVR